MTRTANMTEARMRHSVMSACPESGDQTVTHSATVALASGRQSAHSSTHRSISTLSSWQQDTQVSQKPQGGIQLDNERNLPAYPANLPIFGGAQPAVPV